MFSLYLQRLSYLDILSTPKAIIKKANTIQARYILAIVLIFQTGGGVMFGLASAEIAPGQKLAPHLSPIAIISSKVSWVVLNWKSVDAFSTV